MNKLLIQPVKEMLLTLFKERPGYIRFLLFLQLIGYSLLWFSLEYENLEYLYMLKSFEGFTETQYSYYSAVKRLLMGLFTLFILPKLFFHESMYCIITLTLRSLSFFVMPWISELNDYFAVQLLMLGTYATWANARSLFTFCVHPHEVGKVYAAVGIVASIAPLISNPAFRQLYNKVTKLYQF